MASFGFAPNVVGLEDHGINECGDVYWNLPPAELCEHALVAGEGRLSANGALVCTTGEHTGRSPNDKFVVDDGQTHDQIWWGPINQRMSESHFQQLHQHVIDHYRGKRLYARDMFAGAEPNSRLPLRVVTETAWHNLFASQLFIRPQDVDKEGVPPRFTILNAPTCKADPSAHGTNSDVFVAIHLTRGLILIGGTAYAGEIKKSIFTIMNYLLPTQGILSMHCSANIGSKGDSALFFGLSGTGKTTLSADPMRRLIGDDEHGWSDSGVFNIEGGCYAKCINLSPEYEPQIHGAIRFGSVLENVALESDSRQPDYADTSLTENTRAAYPLDYIDRAVIPSIGSHPKNVIFLTCDAFGVLPPISKLTPQQAMYHFLSGYTAKVAGTEAGVTEPKATFSTCFGAPFLPLPPIRYANMLGERLAEHDARCWLVNTGWSGGGYGVGKRINLRYTRAMVKAALSGELDRSPVAPDPVFGVAVPQACHDIPTDVLNPRQNWKDVAAYDEKARALAGLFHENFSKIEDAVDELAGAGPRL